MQIKSMWLLSAATVAAVVGQTVATPQPWNGELVNDASALVSVYVTRGIEAGRVVLHVRNVGLHRLRAVVLTTRRGSTDAEFSSRIAPMRDLASGEEADLLQPESEFVEVLAAVSASGEVSGRASFAQNALGFYAGIDAQNVNMESMFAQLTAAPSDDAIASVRAQIERLPETQALEGSDAYRRGYAEGLHAARARALRGMDAMQAAPMGQRASVASQLRRRP